MATIAFFDFLSHADMHLPFNQGYLNVLHQAFPKDSILCCASEGHLANLQPAFSAHDRMTFLPIAPLSVARTTQAYNPAAGRAAARACCNQVTKLLSGKTPRLMALGGMDVNLLAVFRRQWQRQNPHAQLHYILHNHLAAATKWRTRNPLLRPFDFLSVFRKPLPPGQAILALELSIAESIERAFPAHRKRVLTLEHPILDSEWHPPTPLSFDRPIRIGFTGHCGRGKGFDLFVDLAKRFSGKGFAFHAIGRLNPNAADLDFSVLATPPSPTGLSRPAFLALLRAMDFVCLPLAPDSRYVASGSIIDAFAAAKPLIIPYNPMLRAIEQKYGRFGLMAPDKQGIVAIFEQFNQPQVASAHPEWIQSIERIRAHRTPAALAKGYRSLLEPLA